MISSCIFLESASSFAWASRTAVLTLCLTLLQMGRARAGQPSWIVDDHDIPHVLREDPPPKPPDKDYWVASHWDWDRGGCFRIPGYYAKKPNPEATGVPGHWEPQGRRRGYW